MTTTRVTVDDAVAASVSRHTRRSRDVAWESWERWSSWSGHVGPPTALSLAQYVVDTTQGYPGQPALKPDSVAVYLAGIDATSIVRGYDEVAHSRVVTEAMRGIRRRQRAVQRKRTLGIHPSTVRLARWQWFPHTDLRHRRDSAMLLVGFHGALRSSELIDLDVGHLHVEGDGSITLRIVGPKGAPTGQQWVRLPRTADQTCPVVALTDWISAMALTYDQPAFPCLSGRDWHARMSTSSVTRMVQRAAHDAGVSDWEHYSSHSLRHGCATALAAAGVDGAVISRHMRHVSPRTTQDYVDAATLRETPTAMIFAR